jgi:hypothetical protein
MTRREFTWPLAIVAFAGIASPAEAHRLDAQCFVLPGWRVQVESWYDTGEPPRGARVEVFRADGQLLTTGTLDNNGVFVFSFTEAEKLKVVVTSIGHRAETTIPAESFTSATACTCAACLVPEPNPFLAAALLSPALETNLERQQSTRAPGPILHHDSPFPLGGALAGVGILLAVAAFVGIRLRARMNHRGTETQRQESINPQNRVNNP